MVNPLDKEQKHVKIKTLIWGYLITTAVIFHTPGAGNFAIGRV